jgi:hypothetical protein
LQIPFEQFKGKGYTIVPPSPRNESSTRLKIKLKMKQGFNHLERILFDEKGSILLAERR